MGTGADFWTCGHMLTSRTSHNISPQGARLSPGPPNGETDEFLVLAKSTILKKQYFVNAVEIKGYTFQPVLSNHPWRMVG